MIWRLVNNICVGIKYRNILSIVGLNLINSRYKVSTPTTITTNRMNPKLHVSPINCLVDDPIRVTVSCLNPHQDVTMAAVLTEDGIRFMSHCQVTADKDGRIDLCTSGSQAGTYTGIDANGLLWSMQLAKGQKKGLRLMKRNVATPFQVKFYAINGHPAVVEDKLGNGEADTCICQAQTERFYLGPGVQRLPVREGRLRGTLFLPPGDGPHPGVVDMFGTAGGLNEYRAALLASRGIAAFALAFFAYDDLPKTMVLQMDYFEEAMDWLSAHPAIERPHIGLIGVSKGAELANYMASINPKVGACVSINSYFFHSTAVHQFKDGQTVVNMQPDLDKVQVTEDGYISREAYLHPTGDLEANLLKPELSENAHFLFICGDDDQMAAPEHAHKLYARLQAAGKGSKGKVLEYQDAGHLLEPPYTPHHRATYHKLVASEIVFGGRCQGHSRAQEDSWRQILAFFREHLPATAAHPKL